MRAVNKHTRVVTDYGPDPRSPAAGVAHDAMLRLHGFLVGVWGLRGTKSQVFRGLAEPVQDFTGAANPHDSGNPVVYRNGAYPDISSAVVSGPMGDPSRRIFAARLKRRRA